MIYIFLFQEHCFKHKPHVGRQNSKNSNSYFRIQIFQDIKLSLNFQKGICLTKKKDKKHIVLEPRTRKKTSRKGWTMHQIFNTIIHIATE